MSQSASHSPTNAITDRIMQRVASMDAEDNAPRAAGAEPAPEPVPPDSPAGSGAASAPEASAVSEPLAPDASAEGATTTPEEAEAKQRREVLAEKLAAAREQRRLVRENAERGARATREQERLAAQAKADREAAAKERRTWEDARKDYRKGLAALGVDPQKAYEEMTRQAIEDGKPETLIARQQEAWRAEMDALKNEVVTLRQERANERAQSEAAAAAAQFEAACVRDLADPAFAALRVEYEDETIVHFARGLRDNPRAVEVAKEVGIRLTDPSQGFTMRELLSVLTAVQVAHDTKREQRRAKLQAPPSPAAAGTKPPTVNGANAQKAGSTVGNDLASARASGGTQRLSRAERAEREIDRLYGSR